MPPLALRCFLHCSTLLSKHHPRALSSRLGGFCCLLGGEDLEELEGAAGSQPAGMQTSQESMTRTPGCDLWTPGNHSALAFYYPCCHQQSKFVWHRYTTIFPMP